MIYFLYVSLLLFFVSLIFCFVFYFLYKKHKKENKDLKDKCLKAEATLRYVTTLKDLKDEENKKLKEKNKALESGSLRDRVDAAFDVLSNDKN